MVTYDSSKDLAWERLLLIYGFAVFTIGRSCEQSCVKVKIWNEEAAERIDGRFSPRPPQNDLRLKFTSITTLDDFNHERMT